MESRASPTSSAVVMVSSCHDHKAFPDQPVELLPPTFVVARKQPASCTPHATPSATPSSEIKVTLLYNMPAVVYQ